MLVMMNVVMVMVMVVMDLRAMVKVCAVLKS
jgi:hypothetical protein